MGPRGYDDIGVGVLGMAVLLLEDGRSSGHTRALDLPREAEDAQALQTPDESGCSVLGSWASLREAGRGCDEAAVVGRVEGLADDAADGTTLHGDADQHGDVLD